MDNKDTYIELIKEMQKFDYIPTGFGEPHTLEELQIICDDSIEETYELLDKELAQSDKKDRVLRIIKCFDCCSKISYIKGLKQGLIFWEENQ